MGKAIVETKVEFLAFLESPNLRKPRISDKVLGLVVSVVGTGPGWDSAISISQRQSLGKDKMPGKERAEGLVRSGNLVNVGWRLWYG